MFYPFMLINFGSRSRFYKPMKKFCLFASFLLLSSCSTSYNVRHSFNSIPTHNAPDYTKARNWSALPFVNDYADLVPDTLLKNLQDSSIIDVFFVHPTTFFDKKTPEWNANVSDSSINYFTDYWAIRHQASIFNNVGKIYAPRYRQAHIKSYFNLDIGGREAILFAYEDVKRAFEYYMEHYNKGRPFIIASHSQGATHATFLIRDYIDQTDLKDKLVAAYLVGMSVDKTLFTNIKLCEDANQTNCYATWQTFINGFTPNDSFNKYRDNGLAVNPITWTTQDKLSSFKDHKGMLMSNYKTVYKNSIRARLNKTSNIVWIDKPSIPFSILKKMKNFHIADYNLYWFDIRANAANRLEQYLNKKGAN